MWTVLTSVAQAATPDSMPPLVGLGVGGALAAVIFWFYVKREREIVATLSKFTEGFQATIAGNATAMTDLTASVRELMLLLRGVHNYRSRRREEAEGDDDGPIRPESTKPGT